MLSNHKAILMTTISTASVGMLTFLSSISPVAAATYNIQGIFNDSRPFSGKFSIENQTLKDYKIDVGSATIPTQLGRSTLNAFTYSPTACKNVSPQFICSSSGKITPTSALQLSFSTAFASSYDSRNLFLGIKNLPTEGGTISSDVFEFYECSRCGGNVASGFKRTGLGTITVTKVPEPKTNWAVLSASILLGVWGIRAQRRVSSST